MNKETLQNTLGKLGLSKNEADVYLTSLSLGPATVLNISKASGITRTTVYSIIDRLKEKGLMHIEMRGLKQYYTAEHPDQLKAIVEHKKQDIERALPDFLALYNLQGENSTISYYEGLEAIKRLYSKTLEPLKPSDDYLVISNIDSLLGDADPEFFEGFLQRRIQTKAQARLILMDTERARHMQKYGRQMNHQVRLLPKKTELSVDIMITPQHIVILNLQEPLSAIQIKNPATLKAQKELFEIMWESLQDNKE